MTSSPKPSVSQEYIASRGSRRVLLRGWQPDDVRAIVAFVHEPGSDGARFDGLARSLLPQGIASYAIDIGEAGRSAMSRMRSPSLACCLADIRAMTVCVRQRHPTSPLFVFGHGTGALAVCCHARLHPSGLDGLIGEAIMLDPPWRATLFRRWHRLGPALRVPRMALVRADHRLRGVIDRLSSPLLLLHGAEDTTAPPSGSEYLHQYAGSLDKTLQVFEGGDHDLINGRGCALVHGKISQWIEGQLASGTRRHIGIEYINE